MIIDFHTHIFPEKIAQRAVASLAAEGGIEPRYDGTESGLLRSMRESGVDLSVTLPVLTAPRQFDSVLEFCKDVNRRHEGATSESLISFAGIHPDCENIGEKMKLIADSGFLGVKIHPDFQGRFINDEPYAEIMGYAREYDLTVITHAGIDASYRECGAKCTPERVLDLIRRVPHKKFVLAHYGGNEMTEEVYELLCGHDIYFDTGLALDYISEQSFKKILDKHGEDKILFATDGPWADATAYIERIRSFGLGERVENKIFYENAARLINLR